MGSAFEVAYTCQECSYFAEVVSYFYSLRDSNERIDLEELLVGEGVIFVEVIELLIGKFDCVQKFVDSDGKLNLLFADLVGCIFPGYANSWRFDSLSVGGEGQQYLLGFRSVFYGRVGYFEPFASEDFELHLRGDYAN